MPGQLIAAFCVLVLASSPVSAPAREGAGSGGYGMMDGGGGMGIMMLSRYCWPS